MEHAFVFQACCFLFQGNKAWGMGATSTLIMMAKFILDCFWARSGLKRTNLKDGRFILKSCCRDVNTVKCYLVRNTVNHSVFTWGNYNCSFWFN